MTTAERYRENHRKRIAKEQNESSDAKEIVLSFICLAFSIAIILIACTLAVPMMWEGKI